MAWHAKQLPALRPMAIFLPLAGSPATPVNDFGIELPSTISYGTSPGSRTTTEAECAAVTPSATTPTME